MCCSSQMRTLRMTPQITKPFPCFNKWCWWRNRCSDRWKSFWAGWRYCFSLRTQMRYYVSDLCETALKVLQALKENIWSDLLLDRYKGLDRYKHRLRSLFCVRVIITTHRKTPRTLHFFAQYIYLSASLFLFSFEILFWKIWWRDLFVKAASRWISPKNPYQKFNKDLKNKQRLSSYWNHEIEEIMFLRPLFPSSFCSIYFLRKMKCYRFLSWPVPAAIAQWWCFS